MTHAVPGHIAFVWDATQLQSLPPQNFLILHLRLIFSVSCEENNASEDSECIDFGECHKTRCQNNRAKSQMHDVHCFVKLGISRDFMESDKLITRPDLVILLHYLS